MIKTKNNNDRTWITMIVIGLGLGIVIPAPLLTEVPARLNEIPSYVFYSSFGMMMTILLTVGFAWMTFVRDNNYPDNR